MSSTQLLGVTTFIYLLASFFYLAHLILRIRWVGPVATVVTAVAVLTNLVGIVWRWVDSYGLGIGYVPLSNMYESLVFFSLAIGAVYLAMEFIYKTRYLGSFSVPFAFLAMAYASLSTEFGKDIKPLLPALQSNWLAAHVITCFIGYAAFAIACGIGILYLVRSSATGDLEVDKSKLGAKTVFDLDQLDLIIHRLMVFGFLWLTAGIITGAVWANSAWGTYWSWDPKETWSLITWFFYALALHLRFSQGWANRSQAWMAVFGFVSTLFTYYGVNFLLSGLHSYGG